MPLKLIFIIAGWLISLAVCCSPAAQAQSFIEVHRAATVIDLHNDVLIAIMRGRNIARDLSGQTHTDLNRLRQGGVDAQVFSVWCNQAYGAGRAYRYANRQLDSLRAITQRYPEQLTLVPNPAALHQAIARQQLGIIIGVEGGHMLENNLNNIDKLYARGVRYLTLTWNHSPSWASSARDESRRAIPAARQGLNAFGRQVIRRMNQLGMLVDLSHAGEKTFYDALATTTKPVIVSHSNVYRLAPHYRNLKDDQIKALARNGGVIGLNFNPVFIDPNFLARQRHFLKQHQPEVLALQKQKMRKAQILHTLADRYPQEAARVRPPLANLLDHLDYIVKLVGVDFVALGSDFDGVSDLPRELNSVADFPKITQALLSRGYSPTELNKILGGNFLRVWAANNPR